MVNKKSDAKKTVKDPMLVKKASKKSKAPEVEDFDEVEVDEELDVLEEFDEIEAELTEMDTEELEAIVRGEEMKKERGRRTAEEVQDFEEPRKKTVPKKKEKKRKRKWLKRLLIVILIVLLAGLGYVGWYIYTALDKTSNVFKGGALDILTAAELRADENGVTNVLVFGTSEDEKEHNGALLADSILVLSVDQKTNRAKVFSLPRDLYVNYTVKNSKVMAEGKKVAGVEDASGSSNGGATGSGASDGAASGSKYVTTAPTSSEQLYCTVGYKGKLNAEYMCALSAFGDDRDKAARYFAEKVSEITGLEIQYYAGVDWLVLETVVDTLGGIDVDVWATDERGIYDVCQGLTLDKGMNYGLDGKTTLKLARARNAMGGYGLYNSNFDREKNQQRIINAIKTKALDVGVLADASKVLTMIDALGENMRTNITMSEVRTVLDIAMDLDGEIGQIETQELYKSGMYNNASIVVPAGANMESELSFYNYAAIQKYIKEEIRSLYEQEEVAE